MNKENFTYPVQSLNTNITEKLKKISSADIKSNINKGLKNEIRFFDEKNHISGTSGIYNTNVKIEKDTSYVEISLAFCQFVWFIADATIKEIDIRNIHSYCTKEGLTSDSWMENTKELLNNQNDPSVQQIIDLICLNNQIDKSSYISYLKRLYSLLKNDPNIDEEFNLAFSLKNSDVELDYAKIKNYNQNGDYEQLSNGIYCYAIAYILLHELSHFELNHDLNKDGSIEDEEDADSNAFWYIFSDLQNTEEEFTANVGILCSLFAILMLEPPLENNETHPSTEKRIFAVYDNFEKSDKFYNKYTVLMIFLFNKWAKYCKVDNFPCETGKMDEDIKKIKEFFNNY